MIMSADQTRKALKALKKNKKLKRVYSEIFEDINEKIENQRFW